MYLLLISGKSHSLLAALRGTFLSKYAACDTARRETRSKTLKTTYVQEDKAAAQKNFKEAGCRGKELWPERVARLTPE